MKCVANYFEEEFFLLFVFSSSSTAELRTTHCYNQALHNRSCDISIGFVYFLSNIISLLTLLNIDFMSMLGQVLFGCAFEFSIFNCGFALVLKISNLFYLILFFLCSYYMLLFIICYYHLGILLSVSVTLYIFRPINFLFSPPVCCF